MGQVLEIFEQEQAILGGILFEPAELSTVAEIIQPQDFAGKPCREVYEAILALDVDGHRVEAPALLERVPQHRELVLELDKFTPTASNLSFYAKSLLDRSIRRQLVDEAARVLRLAREPTASAATNELLDDLEQRILELRTGRVGHGFKAIGEVAKRTVSRLEEQLASESEIIGMSSGFYALDEITGGFRPGQLVVIGARPKMGKSAIALQIADHVAEVHGGAGVFSLEMTEDELGPRLLASLAKVEGSKFRNAKRLSEYEWARIVASTGHLITRPLFIDDKMQTTIGEIRSKARRLALTLQKAGKALKLVVLDYMQLAGEYGEHREQEIAAISRGLKALAKELQITVIAVSQLNRNLDKRPDRRPVPSDLRDSGSLEQDADLVVFLYRHEVYHPNCLEKGKAELIVSLNRAGPTGIADLKFEDQFTRFSDVPHQHELEMPKREEPPHPAETRP